jgi:hypothetical protein
MGQGNGMYVEAGQEGEVMKINGRRGSYQQPARRTTILGTKYLFKEWYRMYRNV